MASRSEFKMSTEERKKRIFSEGFKKKKVKEIEQKLTTVTEVSRAFEVRKSSIYKWIEKYSSTYSKQERVIVEAESDTKKLLELQAKIAELERVIGQKQVQLDFKDKIIELAEIHYGIDIKKNSENMQSSGSGSTGKS